MADRLEREQRLPTVAPGNLLRAEKAAGTELGKRADEQTRYGRLVDDETVNAIVAGWIGEQSGSGFVFDGYPRTIGQADALEQVLERREMLLEKVILLDAQPEVLLDRVAKRAICSKCGNIVSIGLHVPGFEAECPRCGGALAKRLDDTAETLQFRMAEYEEKTAPLIEYYQHRNLLSRIDASQSPEQVYQEAVRILA